jgi:O-antigen/teichoic acid export membrane protein
MALLRHSAFNLAGMGLPLLVAVFSIPILLQTLGTPRFGLLTLIWAIVSYLGLFDLGLGRALTRQLAITLATGDAHRAGAFVATASLIMGALGVVSGALLAGSAPWVVGLIDGVPDRPETLRAVYAMALVMPAVVLTSGFRGVLEARHAFAIVNLIRLPMGLFTFLGPLAVALWIGPRLDWIAATLAIGRVVACAVHAHYAFKVLPADSGKLALDRSTVRPLCFSGGWLAVSNVVSPLLGYVDRFIIGSAISAAAVAYYAVPNELITKLWILPTALTSVLFPAFASAAAVAPAVMARMAQRAVGLVAAVMLPICILIGVAAGPLLSLWIGADFAQHSKSVLTILAAGMFISSLASIPFTALQGAGKARITGTIHLLELPLFMAIVYVLTTRFGVIGAAWAWTLRVCLDTALMFHFYCRLQREHVAAGVVRAA